MLRALISSQDKFLRYLLLLLFEGESAYFAVLMETKLKGTQAKRRDWLFGEDMPLFEELVRAYSRYPEKIYRIADLVDDLSKTEEGRKVLQELKELNAEERTELGKLAVVAVTEGWE